MEIITDDYTSPSFFPFTSEKYHVEPIVHGFISTSRVKDLIDLYKINIVQKLIPGLHKPGYEETGTTYVISNFFFFRLLEFEYIYLFQLDQQPPQILVVVLVTKNLFMMIPHVNRHASSHQSLMNHTAAMNHQGI